jgi:hypothetical protein
VGTLSAIMKYQIIFLFSIPFCFLYGQEELKSIDTTFDFKERFYQNGKLTVTNTILYIDSVNTYTINQIQSNQKIDTTQLERVQHGLWIEYFNKKWNPSNSSNFYYYRLCEYQFGYTTGKIYYFNKKDDIIKTALRYPKMNDTIFEGVRKITYQKGKIIWIEYNRFIEDSLKGLYVNLTSYYQDGKIKSYSLLDDFNYDHHTLKYNKTGLCKYELKLNKKDSFLIKRKRKGKKEIIETKENGNLIKIIKLDGKEIRRKKCR